MICHYLVTGAFQSQTHHSQVLTAEGLAESQRSGLNGRPLGPLKSPLSPKSLSHQGITPLLHTGFGLRMSPIRSEDVTAMSLCIVPNEVA